MVLLTMTPAMVEALEKIQSLSRERDEKTQHCSQEDATPESKEEGSNEKPIDRICSKENEEKQEQTGTESQVSNTSVPLPKDTEKQNQKQASTTAEPSVSDPKVGNPISHGQVIDISKQMRTEALQPSRLEELLRGSRVYIPPPKPKPEPVSDIPHGLLASRMPGLGTRESINLDQIANMVFGRHLNTKPLWRAFAAKKKPDPTNE
jgi:hypothetical protein